MGLIINLVKVYWYLIYNYKLSTAQARTQKKLQHPTRPVDNVALTTKGLHKKNKKQTNKQNFENQQLQ